MAEDPFHYEVWVEEALRGVIRAALREVAANGLLDNHHFYIAFRTDDPDVVMPDWLREKYPREITIVLQHEFWDLHVEHDRFQVTLSFNDVQCPLEVPLGAVISFADPAVKFGLQFQAASVLEGDETLLEDMDVTASLEEVFEQSDAKEAERRRDSEPGGGKAAPTGKVIALDAFRNKK